MRKFILISFLLISIGSNAQSSLVKLHLSPFVFNNMMFSYEYAFNEGMSGSLQFGFHYPKGSIFNTNVKPFRQNLNGIFITPEFRFYTAENAPSGFYIGPYIRYTHYSTEWDAQIVRDSINLVDYTTILTLNETGLGVQLGYQLPISDHFGIDFYFFGPRISWFAFKGKFSGLINEDEIIKAIGIDGLDSNGFYGIGQMIVDFIGDKATIRLPVTFVALRGGISLVYAF